MLVNISNINTGDDATPELWNERFGAIVDVINGQLDSDNLQDGAVLTSKLASKAVTPDKIADQPAWTNATYQNGWVTYDAAYGPASYWKDSLGIVHLRGMVKNGGIGTTIFTLPVGFRPSNVTLLFVTICSGGIGRLDVVPDGQVRAIQGANPWFSIDGVTFRAEQ